MYRSDSDGLQTARDQLVSYSARLLADGLAVGSAGNMSVRLAGVPGAGAPGAGVPGAGAPGAGAPGAGAPGAGAPGAGAPGAGTPGAGTPGAGTVAITPSGVSYAELKPE